MAVGFGYDEAEGRDFYQTVSERFGAECGEVKLVQIGATIAVHTGPYAIGIGCVKRYECFRQPTKEKHKRYFCNVKDNTGQSLHSMVSPVLFICAVWICKNNPESIFWKLYRKCWM